MPDELLDAVFAPETPEPATEVPNDASAGDTAKEEKSEAPEGEDTGEKEPQSAEAADTDSSDVDNSGDGDEPEEDAAEKKPDTDDVSEEDIQEEDGKHWVRKGKWNRVVGIFKSAQERGFSSREELDEALDGYEHRRASVADFQSEDPLDQQNFLDQWRSVDASAFQRLITQIPSYLERVSPDTFLQMVEPLARNQIESMYAKARAYANDSSLSEEERNRGRDYYLATGMILELEHFGKNRSAEEVLGQPVQPRPDPRDERLKEYETKEQREFAEFVKNVGGGVASDLNAKISAEVDKVLKPYKDSGATELELRGARDEINALIRSSLNKNSIADAGNRFNAAMRAGSKDQMRQQISTLVELHGKIVSSAVTIAKNSDGFKSICRQLGKRGQAAVQRREAAQRQKAPVASVGVGKSEAPSDWRKAPTKDQAINQLFG